MRNTQAERQLLRLAGKGRTKTTSRDPGCAVAGCFGTGNLCFGRNAPPARVFEDKRERRRMAHPGGGLAGGLPDRRRAGGGCGGKGRAEGRGLSVIRVGWLKPTIVEKTWVSPTLRLAARSKGPGGRRGRASITHRRRTLRRLRSSVWFHQSHSVMSWCQ